MNGNEHEDGTYIFPSNLDKLLFNITADPSETTDLSHEYPDVVQELLSVLGRAHAQRVPLATACVDARSRPSLFNNTWSPWLEDDEPLALEQNCLVAERGTGSRGPPSGLSGTAQLSVWLLFTAVVCHNIV